MEEYRFDGYFYFIYRTTNLVNGKYYIGMHKTKNLDDGYLGSGLRLNYAIEKYGKENFKRDILSFEKDFNSLCEAEKNIVNEDLLKDEDCYNITLGGKAPNWLSIKRDEHFKIKVSGKNNSQFGTCWICNLASKENLKIEKEEIVNYLNKGWKKGRNLFNKKEKIKKKRIFRKINRSVHDMKRLFMMNPETNEVICTRNYKLQEYLDRGFLIKKQYQ